MHYYIASTYGSSSYNATDYNGTTNTTASTSQSTTGSSQAGATTGTLANTGFPILIAVSLACLIIFAALLIRFAKRPSHQPDM